MQKKLIALAIAGLVSGAAFAQTTNVTIGGNVNFGYAGGEQKSDYTGTNGQSYKYKNEWAGFRGNDNSGWTTSELRINVVEDLGNGLRAGYDHNIALNIYANDPGVDTDTNAFGRTRMSRGYLQSNSWGRIALGYQYTLEDQTQGLGRAGTGNLSSLGEAYNSKGVKGAALKGVGEITRANVIEYASPVFNGLQFAAQAGYTDNEETTKVNGIKTTDNETKGQLYGVNVKYANGPLNLGAVIQYSNPTYDTITPSSTTNPLSSDSERTTYLVSGNYDFGVAKLFAKVFYRDGNLTTKDMVGGYRQKMSDDDTTYTGGDIGVQVPFANRWKFMATAGYGQIEYKSNFRGIEKGQYDIWAYQAALQYSFSKRTALTGYIAQNEWEGKKRFDDQTDKRWTAGVGLNHTF